MKYALTGMVAAAALAAVALSPGTAEAGRGHHYGGWGGGWGGPGFGVYVGPRSYYHSYGYRPYRPYYNRYSYGYGPRWKYRHRYYD
jgi:hypothetical protein